MKGITDRSDAERFVKGAQDVFNEKDLDAAMSVYTEAAEVVMVTDGVIDTFRGKDAIYRCWKAVYTIFPEFRLTKTLSFFDPEVGIFNEWDGSMYGKKASYGQDLWFLGQDGLVHRHKLITFSQILPSEGFRGSLQWVRAHPRYALSTLLVRKKLGI